MDPPANYIDSYILCFFIIQFLWHLYAFIDICFCKTALGYQNNFLQL